MAINQFICKDPLECVWSKDLKKSINNESLSITLKSENNNYKKVYYFDINYLYFVDKNDIIQFNFKPNSYGNAKNDTFGILFY